MLYTQTLYTYICIVYSILKSIYYIHTLPIYTDKHRRITSRSDQSGSTPNRNHNFKDISQYIMDLTISIIKADLNNNNQYTTVQYFDLILGMYCIIILLRIQYIQYVYDTYNIYDV